MNQKLWNQMNNLILHTCIKFQLKTVTWEAAIFSTVQENWHHWRKQGKSSLSLAKLQRCELWLVWLNKWRKAGIDFKSYRTARRDRVSTLCYIIVMAKSCEVKKDVIQCFWKTECTIKYHNEGEIHLVSLFYKLTSQTLDYNTTTMSVQRLQHMTLIKCAHVQRNCGGTASNTNHEDC